MGETQANAGQESWEGSKDHRHFFLLMIMSSAGSGNHKCFSSSQDWSPNHPPGNLCALRAGSTETIFIRMSTSELDRNECLTQTNSIIFSLGTLPGGAGNEAEAENAEMRVCT